MVRSESSSDSSISVMVDDAGDGERGIMLAPYEVRICLYGVLSLFLSSLADGYIEDPLGKRRRVGGDEGGAQRSSCSTMLPDGTLCPHLRHIDSSGCSMMAKPKGF